MKNNQYGWIYFLFLSCTIGSVYSITLNRSIGFTDSGELAAVAYTLSIAHPTGYPIFTLLCRLVAMSPLSTKLIVQYNIFAMVMTLSSMLVFYCALEYVLTKIEITKKITRTQVRTIACGTTVVLAFSTTVWSQSVNIEVYSLHLLFLALLLYSVFKVLFSDDDVQSYRWMCFTSYTLGLSFGNHMTTVLTLPAILFVWFTTKQTWKSYILPNVVLLGFFLIGVSVYCYLPVRGQHSPPLVWGDPTTIEQLLWHISGKQYRIWMFEGWDVARRQLVRYFSSLGSEFVFPLFIFVLWGGSVLWRHSRKLFWILLLFFLTTILYAINYSIFDIESYFLLSYYVIAIILSIGLVKFFIFLTCYIRGSVYIHVVGFLLLFAFLQVMNNIDMVRENSQFEAEMFARETLQSLPENAVVLTGLWDYLVSPALYLQHVEGIRKDVVILDYHLLKNRSWYFIQLRNLAPWLYERCSTNIDAFLGELSKFEHNEPYNPLEIQTKWENMLHCIADQSSRNCSFFVDLRLHNELPQTMRRIPWGAMIRLVPPEDTTSQYRIIQYLKGVKSSKHIVSRDLDHYRRSMVLWTEQWIAKSSAKK
ncbi:MAG: DUF2723 domain-containing protein [Bacteroidetes bacterium]|nr:DUF2723 domain-containing protein [Bacteroidota bacterium]